MPQLYTIPETARTLRLGESTVKTWLSQGKIGHVKVGRRTLITAEEIQRVVAEGTKPSKQ